MHRVTLQTAAALAFTLGFLGSAHAVECADPAWTRAITQAMGRAPAAGECNRRCSRFGLPERTASGGVLLN